MSTAEKAHKMRQVCAVKANVSEPLLKCRKRMSGCRNRGPVVAPGRIWRGPVFLARWRPGMKVARARRQAPVRNVGTPRHDAAVGQVEGRLAIRENLKQLKL
jgi:hypothetical protein